MLKTLVSHSRYNDLEQDGVSYSLDLLIYGLFTFFVKTKPTSTRPANSAISPATPLKCQVLAHQSPSSPLPLPLPTLQHHAAPSPPTRHHSTAQQDREWPDHPRPP